MIPMANSMAPTLITTSVAATTTSTQMEQTYATSSNISGQNSTTSTQPTALEIISTLSDNSGGVSGTVPAFEQTSGSMDIDCFSYEGFFSNTTQQTENHQTTSNEVSINSALVDPKY
jgi:hypothetical protein